MKLSYQIFCNPNEQPLLGNFEVSIDPGSIDLEVSGIGSMEKVQLCSGAIFVGGHLVGLLYIQTEIRLYLLPF